MNWLFLILIIITVLSAVAGYCKGFVRTAFSMVFLILVLVLSGWLSPYVSTALEEHTQITDRIHDACKEMLMDSLESQEQTQGGDGQETLLENAGLPQGLLDIIFPADTQEPEKAAEEIADSTAKLLTELAVDTVVYILSFLAAWIILKLIMSAANAFAELPVIGFVNRICGGLLGVVRALFLIWLFFLVLTVFSGTEWGASCLEAVREEPLLLSLYQNNPVLEFLLNVF